MLPARYDDDDDDRHHTETFSPYFFCKFQLFYHLVLRNVLFFDPNIVSLYIYQSVTFCPVISFHFHLNMSVERSPNLNNSH